MESSIAEFVERQLACELLPTDMTFVFKAMLPPKPGCPNGVFQSDRFGFAGLRVCWGLRRSRESHAKPYIRPTSHNPDPFKPQTPNHTVFALTF